MSHEDETPPVPAEPPPSDASLHEWERHPDYEYETTDGPRKNFDQHPPQGEGWEPNIHRGRDGWDRFDYHEEAYWMRRKSAPPAPAPTTGAAAIPEGGETPDRNRNRNKMSTLFDELHIENMVREYFDGAARVGVAPTAGVLAELLRHRLERHKFPPAAVSPEAETPCACAAVETRPTITVGGCEGLGVPNGEYVPKADYDALIAKLAEAELQRNILVARVVNDEARAIAIDQVREALAESDRAESNGAYKPGVIRKFRGRVRGIIAGVTIGAS